jgi:hypothetical protein
MAMAVEKAKIGILVRATRTGYYNNRRIKAGQTFHVTEKAFSDASKVRKVTDRSGREITMNPGWMEKVEQAAPAPAPAAKNAGKKK